MRQSRPGQGRGEHLTSPLPTSPSGRLLTLHEAAELLRVSRGDLLDAVAEGSVSAVDIAGEPLIPQDDLWRRLSACNVRPYIDAAATVMEREPQHRGCGWEESRWAATELLSDLLTTSARHGVTLADFGDPVTLAQACLAAVAREAGSQRPSGGDR